MGWIPYIERVDDLAPPFGVFVETRDYISEAIYSILSNDFEVAALISTRIYPNLLPLESEMEGSTSLVKNGTFKDDSEWTWGDGWEWYAAAGRNQAKWDEENFGDLEQDIGIIAGHTYQVVFELVKDVEGDDAGIKPEIGGTQGSEYKTNDTFTEILTATNAGNLKFIPVGGPEMIGYAFVDNIYVYDLSLATLPAITYQELTALRQYVMTGPIGMARFRFQINCWASTYASADELSTEVRKALDGYSGTVENQYIHFAELIDEADMLENIAGLDVIKKYGKRLDFYVWSNELRD